MGRPYENNVLSGRCVGATRQGSPNPGHPAGDSFCQRQLASIGV
jgi:hypothetical protein